jgi:hypothetical protein
MNSASRGGRAAKNAIDGCNNTSNVPRVKVWGHDIPLGFCDDSLFGMPVQVIKSFLQLPWMQKYYSPCNQTKTASNSARN